MCSLRSALSAILLLGLLLAAVPASAASGYRPPPLFPGVRSVLWIGAHPDDESLVAPLLARLCLDEGLACTFLVATRGERGHCLLADGCLPNLAAVRTAEMTRSARYFGARLTLWDLPDGGATADGEPGVWDTQSGGHANLVQRLAGFIDAAAPDLVLTFDRRHGTTCHPDHRAVGALAIEAVAAGERKPFVVLLETRAELTSDPPTARLTIGADAASGAFGFDANARRRVGSSTAWQSLIDTLRTHRSQFAPALVQALAATPRRARTVTVGPAALLLASPTVAGCGE